jgi:hypothetical protein
MDQRLILKAIKLNTKMLMENGKKKNLQMMKLNKKHLTYKLKRTWRKR